VREYAGRMAIEETFRDWHHPGAVRTATAAWPTEAMVTRLIGTVCLAYTLQLLVGSQVCHTSTAQGRCTHWTVTGRISVVVVRPARLYRSRLRLESLARPTGGES
jgi:hypothetical protein